MHDLAKAIHIHYDDYKNADPGSIGWAMDRQNFQWVVPFHGRHSLFQIYRGLE